MKLPIWVHQVQTSYGKAELGSDDSKLPASAIYGKVADGLYFMSRYDASSAAIDGLSAVVGRERMHEADGGREWVPWAVPRGAQPGQNSAARISYARSEARLYAKIAVAGAGPGEVPEIILDLEPYYHGGAAPQFWRSDLMASLGEHQALIKAWVQMFSANVPSGSALHLSVDARRGTNYDHLAPIQLKYWRKAIAAEGLRSTILPQVYWTDFKTSYATALTVAAAALEVYGVPPRDIAPVFPGDAVAVDMVDAIHAADRRGMQKPSIWQRMNLSAATAAAVGRMEDPWTERTTTEVDLREPLRAAYRRGRDNALRLVRSRLTQELSRLEGDLVLRGGTDELLDEALQDLLP